VVRRPLEKPCMKVGLATNQDSRQMRRPGGLSKAGDFGTATPPFSRGLSKMGAARKEVKDCVDILWYLAD